MAAEKPVVHGNSQEGRSAGKELEYRLRQQQCTTRYALFALQTYDLALLLQEAACICAEGLQSQMCKVMEYLPEEHRFIVRAGVGWKPGVVGKARVGADTQSPAGYAFMTGEAVISNHLEGERRFRTPAILAEHGVRRAINAPIPCGGKRFGVLEADSSMEGRFTEADLVFVEGFANLIGVALERQRIEQALKHKEALLEEALEHQKFLSEEVGHRVKNSLSIVAGLLGMQGRATQDERLRQALSDAQARVHAIAKVHDRLWRRDDARTVDLAEFLGALCEDLHEAAPNHELVCDVVPVAVATEEAISLGLLANELVTNAFKYAYPGASGRVTLCVTQASQDMLRLEVADQGVGLPDAGPAASGGLGKRVIATLSRHLGGEVEWQDAHPGTRFVLVFRPQSVTGGVFD